MSIKLIESEAVKSESKTRAGTPVTKLVWEFNEGPFAIRVSLSQMQGCDPDLYWSVKKFNSPHPSRDGFTKTLKGAQRSVNAAINKMN